MAIVKTLVTDRTRANVDRWQTLHDKGWAGMGAEERLEWLAGMKGAYNYTDLNRVASAIHYLCGIFNGYGYSATVSTKTDWTMQDVPVLFQMETLLRDVGTLRALLPVPEITPPTPQTMEFLDYIQANHIEEILLAIDDTLNRMRDGWFYSGEVFSGEV